MLETWPTHMEVCARSGKSLHMWMFCKSLFSSWSFYKGSGNVLENNFSPHGNQFHHTKTLWNNQAVSKQKQKDFIPVFRNDNICSGGSEKRTPFHSKIDKYPVVRSVALLKQGNTSLTWEKGKPQLEQTLIYIIDFIETSEFLPGRVWHFGWKVTSKFEICFNGNFARIKPGYPKPAIFLGIEIGSSVGSPALICSDSSPNLVDDFRC